MAMTSAWHTKPVYQVFLGHTKTTSFCQCAELVYCNCRWRSLSNRTRQHTLHHPITLYQIPTLRNTADAILQGTFLAKHRNCTEPENRRRLDFQSFPHRVLHRSVAAVHESCHFSGIFTHLGAIYLYKTIHRIARCPSGFQHQRPFHSLQRHFSSSCPYLKLN